ncbi:MAG: class I SAM-dependent methyltransferase [Verrucomicrobia bacterium]|nr:class I SAM-dependent methyltransferase [Verrucomicrobiota bacterium]
MSTQCPACKLGQAALLGQVPARSSEFGFSDGGNLYECPDCHLLFLNKPGAQTPISHLYEELPSDLLDEVSGRRDFELAAQEILKCGPDARVLDVGCFRGDFLASLPPGLAKYGIEPSQAARRVAEARNIQVIGESVETTACQEMRFDVIVMMDVVEHLPDPFEGISKVSRWLAPGGRVIITTGNSDALPWRLARLSYWYYLPQHISFCNPRWFRWVAARLGLQFVRTAAFSHSRRAYRKWFVAERWRQFAKCLGAWALARLGSRTLLSRVQGDATWPDHLLVVLAASPAR